MTDIRACPELSQDSLERIAIAVMQATDKAGRMLPLYPDEFTLAPWLADQMPRLQTMTEGQTFNPLRTR